MTSFQHRRRRLSAEVTLAMAAAACLMGADWQQFRGTDNSGVAGVESLPQNWSENIAWKSDLPGRGPSGPIVVKDRVFVTASSGVKQDRLHVLAFDAKSGEPLWHRQLWATGRTFTHPSSANAAPTPASDGERVFAFYSSNDLACFDLDGNLLWYRGLAYDYPKAGNDIGMASSPLVVGDTVVVQVESQGDSFAAGFDVNTGETRWRHIREPKANWASPTVLRGKTPEQDRVLLQSTTGLTAHEPQSGKEVWRFEATCAGISSPVAVDRFVFVPSGGITLLKPAGSATPEVVWEANKLSTGSASPVVTGGRIHTVNSAGVMTCGDVATGEVLWQLRLKGRFWATPVAAGDHLYLVNSDGLVQVVKSGEKGELVSSSELGEKIQGTPAVADGALFVRSDKFLWKIAEE